MTQKTALRCAPFIVGVGRSGTTLLRLMLDKHLLFCIPPETHFIGTLLNRARTAEINAERFLDVITSATTWADFDLDKHELRRRIMALPRFSMREGLRSFYAYYAEQQEKPFWGDKTPLYLGMMREIHQVLPEAFFIHLIRDGRDSALSYRGLWFGPGSDPVRHAKMWSARIAEGRSQADYLDGRYLEVRYERLVTEPENVLREICATIKIEYDDIMLKYHTTARDRISQIKGRYHSREGISMFVESERMHDIFWLTSSPPDEKRVGRWRTEMTREEQIAYEREAGHLLSELGYETYYPEVWRE
jgi:hypothetical protein